jgi:recombination protein RecA
LAAKKEKSEPTREEKVQEVISKLNKEYGKGTVITNEIIPDVERFSSDCYSLDEALGGGWGKGRIIEIVGNESSGKTTAALHAIASTQKSGGLACICDLEHAYDPFYASNIGVDNKGLIFSQADHAEAALAVAEELAKSGAIDLIVIDSVAALVPKAEVEGGMSKEQMGLQARMMSKAMRLLTGPAGKSGTTLMFLNQFREKMSLYGGKIPAGGNALKFYASQRLELYRQSKPVEVDGEPVGIEVNAKVIKNKIAPPFKQTSLRITYGKGIDKELDLLRAAINKDIVEKAGGWYTYKDLKIQGEEKICRALKEDTKLLNEIIEKLKCSG